MAMDIYHPSKVTVLLGGVVHLSGYLDGTFLEVTKDVAPYTSERAVDGTTARMAISDRNYTIKFSLTQNSEANSLLQKLQLLDETTQLGMFPLLIKDGNGTSLLYAPTAWVEALPSLTYSTGLEGRTWEIKASGCVSYIGGGSPDSTTQDVFKTILSAAPQLKSIVGGFL